MDMLEEERTFPQQWCLEPQKELADCQTLPLETVANGTYQCSPQQKIRFEGETIELWASLDPLALKAVRQITRHSKENSFAFRSDVKGYHASIYPRSETL